MIKFETIEELKQYANFSSSTDLPDLQMHLERAYNDRIVPIFEFAELQRIEKIPQAPTDTVKAIDLLLLRKIKAVIATFGYYNALPFLNLQVNSAGINELHTETQRPAAQWRYREVQDQAAEMAYNALNALIDFLFSQKFRWKNPINSMFFPTLQTFEEYVSLGNSAYTFFRLATIFKEVERDYLHNLVGEEMWREIKSQYNARTLTEKNEIILEKMIPLCAYQVYRNAINRHFLQIFGNGFKILDDNLSQNFTLPKSEDLVSVQADLDQRITQKRNEIESYLLKNIGQFPLYERFLGLDRVEKPYFPNVSDGVYFFG